MQVKSSQISVCVAALKRQIIKRIKFQKSFCNNDQDYFFSIVITAFFYLHLLWFWLVKQCAHLCFLWNYLDLKWVKEVGFSSKKHMTAFCESNLVLHLESTTLVANCNLYIYKKQHNFLFFFSIILYLLVYCVYNYTFGSF